MKKEEYTNPNKEHAAVCGLFCASCGIYLDTTEAPEKLAKRAEDYELSIDEVRCHGCRSDTLFIFCRKNCFMKPCAAEKKIDFCFECPEYPCSELKDFQSEGPHRIELWKSQERIREAGYEIWYREMLDHYSCPKCDSINSAYDIECRSCGEKPSCAYVKNHLEAIQQEE